MNPSNRTLPIEARTRDAGAASAPAPTYAILIAAKNEEKTVGITLQSIAEQTILPIRCVVASDGSTDRTDQIVTEYSTRFPWISLLPITGSRKRSFASKVAALNQALSLVLPLKPDYVGLLDADVRFKSDFTETLLRRLDAEPALGIAGGLVVDIGTAPPSLPHTNLQEVAGATFFLRRPCLEGIKSLPEIPEGGFDTITLVMARMLGYTTTTFADLVVDHLKPRNAASGSALRRSFVSGRRDHAVGNHPLFELAKCLSRLSEPPPLLGSIWRAAGYLDYTLRRKPRAISNEVVAFLRKEQMARINRSAKQG